MRSQHLNLEAGKGQHNLKQGLRQQNNVSLNLEAGKKPAQPWRSKHQQVNFKYYLDKDPFSLRQTA